MRFWLITTSYPREPSESQNAGVLARDLAIALKRRGHDVLVLTPDKPGGVTPDHGLRLRTIPWLWPSTEIADVNPMSARDLLRVLSLMISGFRICNRATSFLRPDAVIALWALPSALFARHVLKRHGTPYCVWMLGSDVWRAPNLPFGTWALTRGLRTATHVFADGIGLARQAAEMTGVRVSFLPSSRRLPAPTVAGGASPYDFLFVGRYHANKGPDILLEALGLLYSQEAVRPRAGFFGSGPLGDSLKNRVAVLGLNSTVSVHEPIAAPDLVRHLTRVKALVIPSRMESIPMILPDAIQTRTPVIVSDVGDIGEIVRRYKLGLVVPPGQPEDLAEAMKQVLVGPLPQPEWQSAMTLFDPEKVVDRLILSFEAVTKE